MEGDERPQDLAYHLFGSSSNHPALPEPQLRPQDLDWVSNLLQLPSHGGSSRDAAGSSSVGGAPGNGTTGVDTTSSVVKEESGVGKEKKKAGSGYKTRKVTKPRYEFRTRSPDDILDDGYRWRKYGQKAVKNSIYPRSYYHCAHHTCNVKKQVQRLSDDTSMVVTTYEGVHNHPCEQIMEALAPLLRQIQFLSKS